MKEAHDIVNEITIGRHKYLQLKSIENPTKEDLRLIEIYEKKNLLKIKDPKKFEDYWNKVMSDEDPKEVEINSHKLVSIFLNNYKKFNDKEFVLNDETKINLYTIAFYFAKDESFFRSPNLVNQLEIGGTQKNITSGFNKGLLIIGNFGNGKSSMLKTFCKTLQSVRDYNFSFQTANNLVRDYNSLNSPEDKSYFWKKLKRLRILIDDAKTEEEASNYGKVNLIKDIIETRSDENLITHLICNFKSGHPNDINQAILELGEKYGSRALDRIFGKYNIIHFKGKSFRN